MPILLRCLTCNRIFSEAPSHNYRIFCSHHCYILATQLWFKCSIKECRKPAKPGRKGFCNAHYLRFLRHGDALAPKLKNTIRTNHNKKDRKNQMKICLNCNKSFHAKHGNRDIYCSSTCFGLHKRKPFIIKKGYKKILCPNHPRSDGKGYVLEHIIILEKKLGRVLFPNEVTHHIDHDKLNNHPDNLTTYSSNSFHISYHRRTKGTGCKG